MRKGEAPIKGPRDIAPQHSQAPRKKLWRNCACKLIIPCKTVSFNSAQVVIALTNIFLVHNLGSFNEKTFVITPGSNKRMSRSPSTSAIPTLKPKIPTRREKSNGVLPLPAFPFPRVPNYSLPNKKSVTPPPSHSPPPPSLIRSSSFPKKSFVPPPIVIEPTPSADSSPSSSPLSDPSSASSRGYPPSPSAVNSSTLAVPAMRNRALQSDSSSSSISSSSSSLSSFSSNHRNSVEMGLDERDVSCHYKMCLSYYR